MEIIVFVGVVAVIAIGLVSIGLALRGMRPKAPEPQSFTPSPVTARSATSTAAPSTSTGLSAQATAEIDRLVAAGQKIAAIKLYRQHTGVGLQQAKDRIDHWSISTTASPTAAVSNAAAAHSSITPPAATLRGSLPASVVAEIDRLVASEQKITAIKLLREHTGSGLKEAKNAIDAWRR